MKNFFIVFVIVTMLIIPSCNGCTNGWKHVYDNDTVEQVDNHQQIGWNYYLLFPGYRYIPTWTIV